MEAPPLVQGFLVGLAVAAPVGPMSVLCMRRTLVRGWAAGFRTGLGIACGDGIYGLLAVLGLASVTRFMLAYDRGLHAVAGAFLIYLGIRALASSPTDDSNAPPRTVGFRSDFGSALLLTLTNPATIVSFAAILTVLSPSGAPRFAPSILIIVGVFVGSAAWWLALTLTIASVRYAVGRRVRRRIDMVAGTALAAFGITELRRSF